MKNNLVASSIALVLAGSVSAPLIADDTNGDDNLIVVSANRIEQNITDILTDVTIIGREDIERIQPQSLVDLLVNVAGVDYTQAGGHGQDTSIFVRGTNSNQVLILIDGIRVGSATLGEKSVSTIPVSLIERVEIVKGPRAAIWGSDAIGGVIQIFTRRYEAGEYRVAATVGSNFSREAEVVVGFGDDKFSNTISYSARESNGFDVRIDAEDDDDGYERQSVSIRGDYKFSESSTLDWVAQTDRGESLFDSPWSAPEENLIEYRNHHWNLRYSYQDDSWNHQASINASRDSARGFETRRQQLTYLVSNEVTEGLSLAGGFEYYEDDISKSETVYNIEKRDTTSAFVSLNYVGDLLLADFAVRYDDVENVTDELTSNLGLGFRINSQHLLSLNYSEGFKAPTFNDLYFPFGGNPDLEFETSENTELVYKGFFDNANLVISIYDSEIDNLIQWMPDANGVWSPQNVGKADISGVDLTYEINQDDFNHKFTADSVDAKDATTNARLIRRAKNHFGYELTHTLDNFDWFAQIQYVGKRPDTDFQTFLPIESDSFTSVNLGLGYYLTKDWKLQLKINDLFNEEPTIVSGYHPIEQEFYFTISYQQFN